MFKISADHVPPPPGLPPPVLWGDVPIVNARLAPYFTDIRTELIPIDFDMPINAPGAVAFFRKYFGPTHVAFNRLDETGQAAFTADLETLWAGANDAPNPAEHMLVRNEYLQVWATRT